MSQAFSQSASIIIVIIISSSSSSSSVSVASVHFKAWRPLLIGCRSRRRSAGWRQIETGELVSDIAQRSGRTF